MVDIDFKVIFWTFDAFHTANYSILFFTPYLEKDLIFLSNLECLTKSHLLEMILYYMNEY